MDVPSDLSGAKEFRIVKRGYDPDEVNTFLDQVALGVGELKRKLAEAEDRAQVAASAPAAPSETDAEEIHRALILAQRAADEEVRKATEEGQGIIAAAEQRAADLGRQAEEEVARRREEGRADLEAEIHQLEAIRDSLNDDVAVLERHVDEQREVVQAAIGELQALLDHPEAFRIAAPSGVGATPAPAVAPPTTTTTPPDDDGPDVDLTDGGAPDPAPDGDDDDDTARPLPDAPGDAAEDVPGPGAGDAGDQPSAEGGGPSTPDAVDAGPPTEAMAAVEVGDDADDDGFLAELRKAMLDEEPLGPRDDAPPAAGLDDDVTGPRRPRFGRRR